MAEPNQQSGNRENWGSRLAFILAAAGSAIGLGNIWRFPILTAESGGGVFVLVYIGCVLLVGLPVMLTEMVVGRAGERNPVGAIRHLGRESRYWPWLGGLGVITGFIIVSYYSVIAGWTISYMFESLMGTFTGKIDTAAHFRAMVASPSKELLYHAIFMVASILAVAAGVQQGIERTIKIAMPALGLVLIILLIRSVTLPGAEEGLSYYLKPDFSKLSTHPDIILKALGQAFFSLSLGMGAIITYGSYLHKKESLPGSAAWVVTMDTMVALLAGCVIFPALVFAGLPKDEAGPGLIFQVLPQVFHQLPWAPWGGIIFGATFFFLLAIAAYTSSISLLEVPVSYLIDEKGWTRKKATWVVGTASFLFGVPSALSLGAVDSLSRLPGIHMGVLDFFSGPFTDFSLVIGGMGISLFVGWKWGVKRALVEIRRGTPDFKFSKIWIIAIRFIAPVAIAAILAFQIYNLIRS